MNSWLHNKIVYICGHKINITLSEKQGESGGSGSCFRMIALLAALALGACGRHAWHGAGGSVPGYAGGNTSCVPCTRTQRHQPVRRCLAVVEAAEQSGSYDRSRRPRTGSAVHAHPAQPHRPSVGGDAGDLLAGNPSGPRQLGVRKQSRRIARDQPVVDVSPTTTGRSCASGIRPSAGWGSRTHPTFGFIHGGRARSRRSDRRR